VAASRARALRSGWRAPTWSVWPDRNSFYGQDRLSRLFADAITAAPSKATALQAVAAAFDAAAAVAFTSDRRKFAAQRSAVIAANTELREREALKRMDLSAAIARAL